jgi:hypothetical protein
MTVEAMDHRPQESFGLDPIQSERMASSQGDQIQESKLSPAIALAKRVDSVEFSQERGRLGQEGFVVSTRQKARLLEAREERIHLRSDVLGKAEPVPALRGAHGPVAPGPSVDIAKEMPMDAPKVGWSKASRRKRLAAAKRRHLEFEGLQDVRVS